MNKVNKAINYLSNKYPFFNNCIFQDFIESESTYIEGNILYYKDIPEALLVVINSVLDNKITINKPFKTFGTMLDLSRNACYKVEYIKSIIERSAMQGVNEIWLYLEDVFDINEPYFGYLRGKYSKFEFMEIVEVANTLGVRLVPCIQTLGHMHQFLRWPYAQNKYADQLSILMIDNENTYQLIERMIIFFKEVFQTDKIHIGLDEAFGFGFGRFFKKYGYVDQYLLFIKHLSKVNDICLKHGFNEVLMWSDMFFRNLSKTNSYYDINIEIPKNYKNDIPSNVNLVYWDYYNTDEKKISAMLKKHYLLSNNVTFASGLWIWTKLAYDYKKSNQTTKAHFKAIKKENIKDIIFTLWNDDGAYCDFETSFVGLFDMVSNHITTNKLPKKVYELIFNRKYNKDLLNCKINEMNIPPIGILWDDPLLAVYINNEMTLGDERIISDLSLLESYKVSGNNHHKIIKELIYLKLKNRYNLIKKYQNKESLDELIPSLLKQEKLLKKLLASHKEQWYERNKVFGFEVLEGRYLYLIGRTKECINRIKDYQEGRIDKIDELEELPTIHQILSHRFSNIYSSSKIVDVLV
ncbi:family 20 glycosylhydrolase [Acholeplasma sp. OttesenSCG-928-E16]|nr:family 20 glycosylhydrolase [Acholeplasma sp. OttesenSCG-928-E16]